MNTQTQESAIIRQAGEGEQYWFFGGGVWTWKTSTTSSGLAVWEVEMDQGKRTPLHTHPIAESLMLLEGDLLYRIDDEDHEINAGAFVMVPAGIPHAFMVVSESARILAIQPDAECLAFYLGASEPLEGSARVTDFEKIAESGIRNGGFTLLGPPPW